MWPLTAPDPALGSFVDDFVSLFCLQLIAATHFPSDHLSVVLCTTRWAWRSASRGSICGSGDFGLFVGGGQDGAFVVRRRRTSARTRWRWRSTAHLQFITLSVHLCVQHCGSEMELGHILWPSDSVTRESSDPETQLTRWPCSITNSKCRLTCEEVFSGQRIF